MSYSCENCDTAGIEYSEAKEGWDCAHCGHFEADHGEAGPAGGPCDE